MDCILPEGCNTNYKELGDLPIQVNPAGTTKDSHEEVQLF